MTQRARQRTGFALLLTMMLVMVAAIALVSAARQSTTEALAARDGAEALQRRWAVTSCRATLLPEVGRLFSEAEQAEAGGDDAPRGRSPVPERLAHRWVSCELAGVRYDLVLTDEQAKYNVQQMAQYYGKSEVRSALRRLAQLAAQDADAGPVGVKLRPMVGLDADGAEPADADTRDRPIESYGGFGQVFADAPPDRLLGTAQRPGPAAWVTCWGDGMLNLHRLPAVVVEQALAPVLTVRGVEELLQARADATDATIPALIDQLDRVGVERKAIAELMLTDQSASHGLWVVAHGATRPWYSFSVLETPRPAPRAGLGTGPGRLGGPAAPPNAGPGSAPGGAPAGLDESELTPEQAYLQQSIDVIRNLIETGNAGNAQATQRLEQHLRDLYSQHNNPATQAPTQAPPPADDPNPRPDRPPAEQQPQAQDQDRAEQAADQTPRRFDFDW